MEVAFDPGHVLGEGTEKKVFPLVDREEVIKLYLEKPPSNPGESPQDRIIRISELREEKKERLSVIYQGYDRLFGDGNEAKKRYFRWPSDYVDGPLRGVQPGAGETFGKKHGLLMNSGRFLGVIEDRIENGFYYRGETKLYEISWKTLTMSRFGKRREDYPDLSNKTESFETSLRLKVCIELADAVSHLHGHGYIHSDLAPQNILVDPVKCRVCLIDMDSLAIRHGLKAVVRGTHGYMAPELYDGKEPEMGTDVWALGKLIDQMLLGGSSRSEFSGRDTVSQGDLQRFHSLDHLHTADFKDSNNPKLGDLLETVFYESGRKNPRKRRNLTIWLKALRNLEEPMAGESGD